MTEALKQALMTLDGIADTNPRNKDDFDSPADWITWAKSRAQFEAGRIRTALTQATSSEQGEPSDSAIDAATRHIYHDGRPTSKEYRVSIVRAAKLYTAQPAPAARPMTREQVNSVFDSLTPSGHGRSRYDIVAAVEAHHGIGSQPTALAVPAEQEAAHWCEYVAGMVWCWLEMQNKALTEADEGRYIKAITGIILRRLKWLKREPAPPAVPAVRESGSFAGVHIWMGDRQVLLHLTLAEIDRGACIENTAGKACALLASDPTSTKGEV
jgi:hypothetical protein